MIKELLLFLGLTHSGLFSHPTDLYLTGMVNWNKQCNQIITVFKKAKANDHINLHIKSPGGRIDTLAAIINAMDHTKASYSIILENYAYSAAADIALWKPENLVLTPDDKVGVHYTVDGNGNMITDGDPEVVAANERGDREYGDLMTVSEQIYMNHGGFVVIKAPDLAKRLCKIRHICNVLKS